MERERVIEILKRKTAIPLEGESFEEICDAYDIAIWDVKKQIPKKPEKVGNSLIRYVNIYKCPTCGGEFTGYMSCKYCFHCGQAIQWEDE